MQTVLIVEDELMVRLPIAEFLRECGYNVLEASDAREAIRVVATGEDVDVVFSDVRMPGEMDGFGLALWLRHHRPRLPVLLTSGYYGGHIFDEALAANVKLIEKPYSQAQVERRIRTLLETAD